MNRIWRTALPALLAIAGGVSRADTTTVAVGFGSTIFPTPVLATVRLAAGGGGFMGGNVTVGAKISYAIAPHWRIPVSVHWASLSGEETFVHRDEVSPGDTVALARVISNACDLFTVQAGIEYLERRPLITPYGGVDLLLTAAGPTTLTLAIPLINRLILSQGYPATMRMGMVLRVGAECPIWRNLVYDASAELGALNLFNRSAADTPQVAQLFVPTQEARDVYTSRKAEGKGGEAIVTFFRLLVKVAWKFDL